MIRTLSVWMLLLIVPFSGLRVICVDGPVEANTAGTQGTSGADCDQLCAVHHPRSSGDSDCSLTADPSSLMLVAAVAVTPVGQALGPSAVVAHVSPDNTPLYLEPGVAHLTPPPKTGRVS